MPSVTSAIARKALDKLVRRDQIKKDSSMENERKHSPTNKA
ncbi:hypothetical protein C2W64_04741 [Brevibacillus laterosporus]|nr:hypothetical protein C2W64_04741 [Brevibacillus laterosporus]